MEFSQWYRHLLRNEFSTRCAVNDSYSLRAFARDIDILPPQLSRVFSGKQGLSKNSAVKIVRNINWNTETKNLFCQLVTAADSKSNRERQEAQEFIAMYVQEKDKKNLLDEQSFQIISSWQHFALLELIKTDEFKSSDKWMAQRLGLSELDLRACIARLKQVGLVEQEQGSLRIAKDNNFTSEGIPSTAIREFNKQVLQKAQQSVDLQTVKERSLSTLTIAVSEEMIPLVQEKLVSFRKELNQYISHHPANQIKKHVYCYASQFFRLTMKEEK